MQAFAQLGVFDLNARVYLLSFFTSNYQLLFFTAVAKRIFPCRLFTIPHALSNEDNCAKALKFPLKKIGRQIDQQVKCIVLIALERFQSHLIALYHDCKFKFLNKVFSESKNILA